MDGLRVSCNSIYVFQALLVSHLVDIVHAYLCVCLFIRPRVRAEEKRSCARQ